MDTPVILIGLVTASQCIAKGLPIDALWDDFGVRIHIFTDHFQGISYGCPRG